MKAAVVRSFDSPPSYEDFNLPDRADADDLIVTVLAAGLHQRVRTTAAGKHYADVPTLPMIPGIDAVGRLENGDLVYCIVHDTPYGTMAEQVVADRRRCLPLPAGVDAAALAAAMNPGMSSWLALRLRAPIQTDQSVLILGATGGSGRMAIHIAKLLGAGRVIAAGRQVSRLDNSGADEVVSLLGDPEVVAASIGTAAGNCDIVLDYLWGEPAGMAMHAIASHRRDRSKPLVWVQIGAVTGPTVQLPSELLRSTDIRLMGSGQGSVSPKTIIGELPSLVDAILAGRIPVDVRRVPLSDVESAWTDKSFGNERVVLIP